MVRLAHPATDDADRKQLFDWVCGRSESGPAIVAGFQRAQSATSSTEWLSVLDEYPALSWEMLADGALGERDVWAKLIDKGLPQTALMRQLPQRDALIRRAREDDRARWSYSALAAAAGCSKELIAAIIKGQV